MLALGETCNNQPPATIVEDSEVFQNLLTFIYPDKPSTVFETLDELLPVLDAAAKYEMGAITDALARQLMSKLPMNQRHQEALLYDDPLRVYVKAKQLGLAGLASAAADASLNVNIYTTPVDIHRYDNMPASWLWQLLEMRQKRVNWWSTRIQTYLVANMDNQYNTITSSRAMTFRSVACNCGHNDISSQRPVPETTRERIKSYPCARAVREIDFAVELKCLRCGAAANGKFTQLCELYEAEFGTF